MLAVKKRSYTIWKNSCVDCVTILVFLGWGGGGGLGCGGRRFK